MGYAERHTVAITTDASGDFTGYTDVVSGRISAIVFTDTNLDATADITMTGEDTGQTIWSESNVNGNKTVAPRQPTHGTDGSASLYAGAGEPVEDHIIVAKERIKVVIAQGGNVKMGQVVIVVE